CASTAIPTAEAIAASRSIAVCERRAKSSPFEAKCLRAPSSSSSPLIAAAASSAPTNVLTTGARCSETSGLAGAATATPLASISRTRCGILPAASPRARGRPRDGRHPERASGGVPGNGVGVDGEDGIERRLDRKPAFELQRVCRVPERRRDLARAAPGHEPLELAAAAVLLELSLPAPVVCERIGLDEKQVGVGIL